MDSMNTHRNHSAIVRAGESVLHRGYVGLHRVVLCFSIMIVISGCGSLTNTNVVFHRNASIHSSSEFRQMVNEGSITSGEVAQFEDTLSAVSDKGKRLETESGIVVYLGGSLKADTVDYLNDVKNRGEWVVIRGVVSVKDDQLRLKHATLEPRSNFQH